MKQIFIISIFILTSSLSAQQYDSTKTFFIEDVVISATRSEALSRKLPSSTYVVNKEQIKLNCGSSLASAMQGASGLFLKSYGGVGSLQTISLRGMSPEHTAILIDGIRVNNAQNGLIDLGVFSSSNIERIEVLKGGSSSLYGTDAVGGVINIITKNPIENGQCFLSSAVGSYNYHRFEQSVALKQNDNVSYQISLRNESGKGNYDFHFNNGIASKTLQRNNADYKLFFADGKIIWNGSENLSNFFSLNVEKAERGSPNPVFTLPDFK